MFSLARSLLFALPPETSHHMAMGSLNTAHRLGLLKRYARLQCPVEVMGLRFPNPIGLAAGLDKNGDYFNALGALGFGFVEIGTVTPKPQPGNPKPRLFRLPEQQAIINRMGFNNQGVAHLVANVKKRRFDGILGINIGKNKTTPDEQALDDYCLGMREVYAHADYITINVSSPNTPGLRALQFGDALSALLRGIKAEQGVLAQTHGRYVPIAVKIAPDMDQAELEAVAGTLVAEGMDAVIATNTTVARTGVENARHGAEAGGLSGLPVQERSTQVIATLAQVLPATLPIIGVGGVLSGADAQAKLDAGAKLVQVYTGFIYRGPDLIKEAVEACQCTARLPTAAKPT